MKVDCWLRPDQVADRLSVSTKTVHRLAAQGYLEAFRLSGNGSSLRIRQSSLQAYIEARVSIFRRQEGFSLDTMDTSDN